MQKIIPLLTLMLIVKFSMAQRIPSVDLQNHKIPGTNIIKCKTDILHQQKMKTDANYRNQYLTNKKNTQDALTSLSVHGSPSCSAGPIIIPVAVHYIGVPAASLTTANKACMVQLAQLQINALNLDYQGCNTDANDWCSVDSNFPSTTFGVSCLNWCLATQGHPAGYSLVAGDPAVTFNGAGITEGNAGSTWAGYLNVFVTTGTGVLGYSPLGGGFNGTGPVIEACAFGLNDGSPCAGGYGPGSAGCSGYSMYNLGRTLTHEIGHYMGLDHTFNGCAGGDGIADTPPDDNADYGCYALASTAGWPDDCTTDAVKDLWPNYMDYTDDACMFMFTSGQTDVMYAHAVSEGFVSSVPTKCTGFAEINACADPCLVGCPTAFNTLSPATTATCSGVGVTYTATLAGAGGNFHLEYVITGQSNVVLGTGITNFTATPIHNGTCGPETKTITVTAKCNDTGATIGTKTATITVNPAPSSVSSLYSIANGSCNGPVVTNTCPSLITITPQGTLPTFPVALGTTGNVTYNVTYNLGTCCSGGSGTSQLLSDTGFEDGDPAAGWAESSTNFSTITCDASCGGSPLWAGTYYAYFAGASVGAGATLPEEGHIIQTITIPSATTATLTFQLSVPSTPSFGASDVFQVLANGTPIWSLTPATAATYASGSPTVSINMLPYATGTATQIDFKCIQNTDNINIYVDNVNLNISTTASCSQVVSAAYGCFGVGIEEQENLPIYNYTYNNQSINFLYDNKTNENIMIDVIDVNGRILNNTYQLSNQGLHNVNIDLKEEAIGMYFIKFSNSKGLIGMRKFINH